MLKLNLDFQVIVPFITLTRRMILTCYAQEDIKTKVHVLAKWQTHRCQIHKKIEKEILFLLMFLHKVTPTS